MSGVPNDPADSRLRWRLTVRDALTALFARGARVTRFVRDVPHGALPYYVVE